MPKRQTRFPDGRELVIGLVAAMGTDLAPVRELLRAAFRTFHYETVTIKLIDWVMEQKKYGSKAKGVTAYDELAGAKITAGNDFCRDYARGGAERQDAFARIAATNIKSERGSLYRRAKGRIAYLVSSLKRKDEIAALKHIYGPNLLVLGFYEPREQRVRNVAARISETRARVGPDLFVEEAKELVARDEREYGEAFGQDVQRTFPLSDVFFDVSDRERLRSSIGEFFETLFGHPNRTPSTHEHAMAHAYATSLRSSATRQVGACIVDAVGEVVAVGANEVPKAFGGQQWTSEGHPRLDLERPVDSNKETVDGIVADLLERLAKRGWLRKTKTRLPPEARKTAGRSVRASLLQRAKKQGVLNPLPGFGWTNPLAQRPQVEQVIEYVRAVHAEMAALMSALRKGTSVVGATLYTTTFPCHECARHIVAAGIKQVFFIEPYPKSRAEHLYDDAVAIDVQKSTTHLPFSTYFGVAPWLYTSLYSDRPRDAKDGTRVLWHEVDPSTAQPRGPLPLSRYKKTEADLVGGFAAILVGMGIGPRRPRLKRARSASEGRSLQRGEREQQDHS